MEAAAFTELLMRLLPALLSDLVLRYASDAVESIMRPLMLPLEAKISALQKEIELLKDQAERQQSQDLSLIHISSPRDKRQSRMPSSA